MTQTSRQQQDNQLLAMKRDKGNVPFGCLQRLLWVFVLCEHTFEFSHHPLHFFSYLISLQHLPVWSNPSLNASLCFQLHLPVHQTLSQDPPTQKDQTRESFQIFKLLCNITNECSVFFPPTALLTSTRLHLSTLLV